MKLINKYFTNYFEIHKYYISDNFDTDTSIIIYITINATNYQHK